MKLKLDSPSKKLRNLKARTEKWRRAFAFLPHRTDDDTLVWFEFAEKHRDWVLKKGKWVWRAL